MFPQLTTDRSFLQPILPEDQQFIFEGLSHPDVIPFYGVRYDSFEATKKQMEWYEKIYNDGTGGSWKIADKNTGENMGVVAYYFHKSDTKKLKLDFGFSPNTGTKALQQKF
jgi:ribosomal-protein-alanine N-acetyltransferase